MLVCCRVLKSHGICSLGLVSFCWAFWDQMLTIEIKHDPKQIKEKLGTPVSTGSGIKVEQASFPFYFLYSKLTWDFWSNPFSVHNLSYEFLQQASCRLQLPQDPRDICFSFRVWRTGLQVGKSRSLCHAGKTFPLKIFLPMWKWFFAFNNFMIGELAQSGVKYLLGALLCLRTV